MPGFKAGQHLYGLDQATRFSPRLVVVVEGVTDVWSVGSMAVAVFGKKVSETHQALLSGWAARGGLCVLCLDPGAWTDEVLPKNRERAESSRTLWLARLKTNFAGRLVEVTLPAGMDPGK